MEAVHLLIYIGSLATGLLTIYKQSTTIVHKCLNCIVDGEYCADIHFNPVPSQRCCRGPTSSLRFLLTSCQHIFCSQCCTTATQPGCFVCAAQQPRIFSIGADLPKEARPFFSNQVDLPIVQLGRVGDFKDSQVHPEYPR